MHFDILSVQFFNYIIFQLLFILAHIKLP